MGSVLRSTGCRKKKKEFSAESVALVVHIVLSAGLVCVYYVTETEEEERDFSFPSQMESR